MSRIVRCSFIQATNAAPPEASPEVTQKALVDKTVPRRGEDGWCRMFSCAAGEVGAPMCARGFAKIGVYLCYHRHFPEGARALGLAGAEIVFNPSATVAGLSEYLWKLEQPAHAVANAYFVGAINRVGFEAPWNIGEFYGQSSFCDPPAHLVAQASPANTTLITA